MDGRQQLLEGIAQACKIDVSELREDMTMNEDLHAKSGTYFAIIAVLEALTDQKVKYATLRKRKTVGEIIELYEELVQA